MRQFAKLVALLLLVVFVAAPAMAAVTCRQAAPTAMNCGSHCPMMARMSCIPSDGNVTREDAKPACCEMSSLPSEAANDQASVVKPLDLATAYAPVREVLALPGYAQDRKLPVLHRPQLGSSQAILCTFLI